MKVTELESIDPEVERLEAAGAWLLRLHEHDLNEQDLQRWLDWCEADPQNLAAFERIQSLWRTIPAEAPEPRLATPPLSRLHRSREHRAKTYQWLGVAAGTAAIAVLLVFARQELSVYPQVFESRIQAPQRVNENSVLPDGSNLALSAGTSVALNFTQHQRRLELRDGIAFFKVKSNTGRPFVVHAGPIIVTALGTAFNIRRHGERVVVTVEEGLVKIDKKDGNTLRAAAGYQLTYDARSRETRLTPADASAELAWRQGRLVYNGEPLEAVIDNVNRYSTKKIALTDPSLAQLRFTGTVFVDSIDTWLGALPRAFPVEVKEESSQIMLSLRRRN